MDSKRVTRGAAALLGLGACASVASAVMLIMVAGWTGSAWWSVTAGTLTATIVACGLPLALRRRNRRSTGESILTRPFAGPALLLVTTGALSLTWLWPGTGGVVPDPVPGMVRLARPDGTALAVHVTRASQATQPPLVVVHGGPGVADMAHDVPAFALLASDRDVYIYDQIGTGASSRLNDPAGYTTARAVRDLEAVRAFTGSDRIALLGHSWGAMIATSYLSAYPNQVAALILSAPGFLPQPGGAALPGNPTERLGTAQRAHLYLRLAWPRNLFAYALTAAEPSVAKTLAGDVEMDRRFSGVYALTSPALFCDPTLTDRLGANGVGYYANQIPQLHPDDAGIDRSSLASARIPVLVIKPACDYIPWHATADYQLALPTARLVMLPGAGHQAYIERPEAYADLVRDFLTGRELRLPLQDGRTVPDGYRGVR